MPSIFKRNNEFPNGTQYETQEERDHKYSLDADSVMLAAYSKQLRERMAEYEKAHKEQKIAEREELIEAIANRVVEKLKAGDADAAE